MYVLLKYDNNTFIYIHILQYMSIYPGYQKASINTS